MSAPGPRWLSDEEMAAWLPLVHLVNLLPQALDRQLREEAGLPHVHYQVLALLSAAPEQALRMSDLARATAMSLSRLSHAVSGLQERGWVERRPCPADRRGQVAVLTDGGRELLRAVAPGHVAEVRRLVVDALSAEELAQLRAISEKLLARLPR